MATLRNLVIAITARTSGFAAGVTNVLGGLGRLERRTRRTNRGFSAMTRTFQAFPGIIGLAGGAGLIRSIGRISEGFEQAMNQSLAIVRGVTPQLRREMEQVAIDTARTTNASAADAARSYFYLASAGLDAKQSIAALPVVARFATAGMFDMATATDLVTDAQSALGLTVSDSTQNMQNMQRVADVLVAANTLANASTEQFSRALTNKGAVAMRRYGKDVEEGVAVLAAFADQGLKDAEAGTALNIVVRDLTTKALNNAKAFEKVGISVFDQVGEMRDMADIVSDLEKALGGLSDAQRKGTLLTLGFTDKSIAFTSALIGTSEKIRGYEDALRKVGGTTEAVAEKQLTPWQKGLSEINAGLTKLGVALRPARDAISGLASSLASGVTNLSAWIKTSPLGSESFQGFAVRAAALTASIGALLASLGLLAQGIKLLIVPALALLSNPIILAAVAIGLLIDQIISLDRIYQKSQALRRQVRPGEASPYWKNGKFIGRTPESQATGEAILDAFRGPAGAANQLRSTIEGPGATKEIVELLREMLAAARETRDSIDGVGRLR